MLCVRVIPQSNSKNAENAENAKRINESKADTPSAMNADGIINANPN